MNLRKHRNLLFWFISVFQIILLALPLADVAKRVIEYQLQPTYYTSQSTTGEPLQKGGYAHSINNALWFSYYDFNSPYTYLDQDYYSNAWAYRDYVIGYEDNLHYFVIDYSLRSYNLFDFDFFVLQKDFYYFENSDSIIQPIYLNWYFNYILSVLVLTFVPSLVVYIYSWFTELGYLSLPRRKENEK